VNANEGQITLSDGRKLGFTESGPINGLPLFYFHGFPGSRKEAGLLFDQTRSSEWRIFAIDRPGMGLSDFMPGRTLRDWPSDVRQLADHLGFKRFSIIGISGGGPYAAVCAWALPERVICAGIACGPDQLDEQETLHKLGARNRTALQLLRYFPWLGKGSYAASAFVLKHWPLLMLDTHRHSLPRRDQMVLQENSVREALASSFVESLRQGSKGGAQELTILCSPWSFDLRSIQPPIALWHGELDTIVPVNMGRKIASLIPGCRSQFFSEDGHYSLLVTRSEAMLQGLRELADSVGAV